MSDTTQINANSNTDRDRIGLLEKLDQIRDAFSIPLRNFVRKKNEYYGVGVIRKLFVLPFSNIIKLWKSGESVKSILVATLPFLSQITAYLIIKINHAGISGSLTLMGEDYSLDMMVKVLVYLSLFLVWYGASMIYFWIFRMPILNDDYFHPRAYATFRKPENNILNTFADSNFNFDHVYDFVKFTLMSPVEHKQNLTDMLNSYLSSNIDILKNEIKEVYNRNVDLEKATHIYKASLKDQEDAINNIRKTYELRIDQYSNLMKMFHAVNDRIVKNDVKLTDLYVLTPFSLYTKEGDVLKLKYSLHSTCEDIPLSKAVESNFAVASAAYNPNGRLYENKHSSKKTFRALGVKIDDEIYVYNFHINPEVDHFMIDLVDGRMVGLEVVIEMVQKICCSLHKNGVLKKEVQHA